MPNYFPNLSRYKYKLPAEEVAAAKRSLYFWWWRYLRLSSDYWWLCQESGKTSDKKFASVYEDFGDVFSLSFDEWWSSYGSRLFAFKVDPPKVGWLSAKEAKSAELKKFFYRVKIPRFQTKSKILAQLSDLLADHEPMPYPQDISTDFEVENLRGIRRQVLVDTHRVWCLNDALRRAIERGVLDRPERYTQYWIGMKLGIEPAAGNYHKINDFHREKYERLAVRVKVNRYLAKANRIIRNVELGNFPVMNPVAVRSRWSKKQKRELAEAIQSGAWVCPESATSEIKSMVK